MRSALLLLVVTALACLTCCGGAASPSSTSTFPIFPMTLVYTSSHEAGEPIATLAADGTLTVPRRSFVAHVSADRIVAADGTPLVLVTSSGGVSIDPTLPPGHFDGRGAIVSPQGDVIFVDDAGVPSWAEPRGGLPPLPARFQPFEPGARRTAEAMFIVTMTVMWAPGMPS